jgi:hypothetical protein
VNATDSLLSIAAAGATEIDDSGTLFYLRFVVPDGSEPGFIPISPDLVLFDNDDIPAVAKSGSVEIVAQKHSDVDLNNVERAFDASLILQSLVGGYL